VAMAKGLSKTADPRRVAIIRTVNGEQKAAVFDFSKIRAGKAGNPEVLPNDIVVVDDSGAKVFWHGLVSSLPAFMIFSYF
jgi:polysaccharide export outer membrane protein